MFPQATNLRRAQLKVMKFWHNFHNSEILESLNGVAAMQVGIMTRY